MKTTEKKVSTGSKEKGTFEEWPIKVTEYEKGDFSISFKGGVQVLGDETVLSLINRQLATDIANESRRERTAGPAKRVDRESVGAFVEAKVVDDEDRTLPAGEVGEICVR